MMLERASSQQGMTLLEVLVAVAIFAVAALSVMKATGQHTRSLSRLEQKTLAAMVADNQLAEVVLSAKVPDKATQGTTEMAGQQWQWQLAPVATETGQLRAVDMSVAAAAETDHPLVTVRTYVATR
ncbi:type II secretion system protein GspI [Salinivibrio kushneri]|uniref:Type II secretion system protein I n=1 Tax=Salinivibrio kushneri TaxID=1908198 RepID=A0AB36KAZ7_9GAMM|nr:type II secretion system minor pseudopilin GspI [Salinivibrio kushneri]OOE45248.1 type II secretion system protein GspI [Salinivibrio kushneri]OOE46745.1 type II secretion system protein GspI [Salinivibrio kushneri]OOE67412.1 type II secretion system protein GspI [Salinivibrio kushneri]